jgi:hypothetical protein
MPSRYQAFTKYDLNVGISTTLRGQLQGNKPFSECHLDCGSESGLFAAQTGGKRSFLRGIGETIRSLKDWVQSYTKAEISTEV